MGRPKEVPQLPSIQDFLVTEMTCQMFTLPPGIPPCFYDLAAEEAVRRKNIEKEKMKMASGSRKERIGSRRGDVELEDVRGETDQDLEQGRDSEDIFNSAEAVPRCLVIHSIII